MQNRYVGDIGDFVKLGILQALAAEHRLGVAWWLYPDESHNKDGRHIQYLKQPDRWRHYAPDLFDRLQAIVAADQRDVAALETAGVLPGAVFASDPIPTNGPIQTRQQARQNWFQTVREKLTESDLVFLDPDNGLEPAGYRHGAVKAGKSVTLEEIRHLAKPGRCLIVYHHHTRRAGGHHAEIGYWADRLRGRGLAARVDALRAKPFSPRVFFLLDAPDDVRHGAKELANQWHGLITWHPDAGARTVLTSGCDDAPVMAGGQQPLRPASEGPKIVNDRASPSRDFFRRPPGGAGT